MLLEFSLRDLTLTTTRPCWRFGLPFVTVITPALAFSGNPPSSVLFASGLFLCLDSQ